MTCYIELAIELSRAQVAVRAAAGVTGRRVDEVTARIAELRQIVLQLVRECGCSECQIG